MADVAPRTVLVFSDIACPWAGVAVHRLHASRSRLGLDGGRARRQVMDDLDRAQTDEVQGSPHLFRRAAS